MRENPKKKKKSGGMFSSVGPGALGALLGKSMPSSIAVSVPTFAKLVSSEELEVNLPDHIDDILIRQFLRDSKGSDEQFEQYYAMDQKRLRNIILNYYKTDKSKNEQKEEIKRFLSEVLDMNYNDVTLYDIGRTRKILETYSVNFLNFFLSYVDGRNGLDLLKEILNNKFLSKLKVSGNEVFELTQLDETFLFHLVVSIRALLRNETGYVEVANDKELLTSLFFMCNSFKSRKQIKLRSEILQFLSIVSVVNEIGSKTILEALDEYEEQHCKKEGMNKFTEFVDVINFSKSQAYLRTGFTFINTILSKCPEEKRKQYVSELNETKLKIILNKLSKAKKLKGENLKRQIDILKENLDKLSHLKSKGKVLIERVVNSGNVEMLDLLGKIIGDLEENYEKKLEFYEKLINGEIADSSETKEIQTDKIEFSVEKKSQSKEEDSPKEEAPVTEKKENEVKEAPVTEEKEKPESDDDDDGPPPPMKDGDSDSDSDDDDDPSPPPPGDDDGDDSDSDDDAPPPPPGDDDGDDSDDGIPPPPSESKKKKKKNEAVKAVKSIFKAAKKEGVKKVLHMDKISKSSHKETIFHKAGISKGIKDVYDESLHESFAKFFEKKEKKQVKQKKKKEDEKKSLLFDDKLIFKTNIALKTIRIEPEKIKESLLTVDEEIITPEIVSRLNNVIPPDFKGDFERIKKYKGDFKVLDDPSLFFYQMSFVPDIKELLSCWNYKIIYEDITKSIPIQLKEINETIISLKDSEKLHGFLKYTLLIANMMQRKEALLGFKFKSLEKLIMTKGGSGRNLLVFLVKYVKERKDDEVLNWGEDFLFLENICGVNQDLLKDEISALEKEIKKFQNFINKTKIETIKTKFLPFLEKMKEDHKNLNEMMNLVVEGSSELSKLYNEELSYIKKEFFGDVKDILFHIENAKIRFKKDKTREEKKKLRELKALKKKNALKTIDLSNVTKEIANGNIFSKKRVLDIKDSSSQKEIDQKEQKEFEEQ